MLRSGTDLQGWAPPQWLAWLHRGWLTLIMWHARRSVRLGQAWTTTVRSGHDMWWPHNHATICTGYQVVVTMQIGLGGRVQWKRQQNDFFCVSVAHNFTSAASQYSSIQYVFHLWFSKYDNKASHKSKFNGVKENVEDILQFYTPNFVYVFG
jgi:hypothetical protein